MPHPMITIMLPAPASLCPKQAAMTHAATKAPSSPSNRRMPRSERCSFSGFSAELLQRRSSGVILCCSGLSLSVSVCGLLMDVLCGRFRRFQAFLSLLCVVPGTTTFDSGLLSVSRVFAMLPASSFLGYSGVLSLSGLVSVGRCRCRAAMWLQPARAARPLPGAVPNRSLVFRLFLLEFGLQNLRIDHGPAQVELRGNPGCRLLLRPELRLLGRFLGRCAGRTLPGRSGRTLVGPRFSAAAHTLGLCLFGAPGFPGGVGRPG